MAPNFSRRSTITYSETLEIFSVPYAGDAAPQFHYKVHTGMENAWSRQGGGGLKLTLTPSQQSTNMIACRWRKVLLTEIDLKSSPTIYRLKSLGSKLKKNPLGDF